METHTHEMKTRWNKEKKEKARKKLYITTTLKSSLSSSTFLFHAKEVKIPNCEINDSCIHIFEEAFFNRNRSHPRITHTRWGEKNLRLCWENYWRLQSERKWNGNRKLPLADEERKKKKTVTTPHERTPHRSPNQIKPRRKNRGFSQGIELLTCYHKGQGNC